MWAWARYDFRLSWEEFTELTPGEFQQLAKRRNIAIRYDRYANALTASAIYNVNRGSTDDAVVTAYDFIRPEDEANKLAQLRETQRYIKTVIGHLPVTTPRAKLLENRRKIIVDLEASGHKDAESLFDEVWPHLKPTSEEKKESKA